MKTESTPTPVPVSEKKSTIPPIYQAARVGDEKLSRRQREAKHRFTLLDDLNKDVETRPNRFLGDIPIQTAELEADSLATLNRLEAAYGQAPLLENPEPTVDRVLETEQRSHSERLRHWFGNVSLNAIGYAQFFKDIDKKALIQLPLQAVPNAYYALNDNLDHFLDSLDERKNHKKEKNLITSQAHKVAKVAIKETAKTHATEFNSRLHAKLSKKPQTQV